MTESDLRAILGENLKKYRTSKAYSQAKLAEILDISPNFISDIETGKRWLSSDTLVNLAEALGIDVYELLKPPQIPTDEIAAFMQTFTEKATIAATEAVACSLQNIRMQYLN